MHSCFQSYEQFFKNELFKDVLKVLNISDNSRFFWSVFSCIWTEYRDLLVEIYIVFNPNTGKYGPEKTLYLDTFHALLECVYM